MLIWSIVAQLKKEICEIYLVLLFLSTHFYK